MSSLRKTLRSASVITKRTLATAAYYSGIAWLRCLWALRRRAVVLMYHRVLPEERMAHVFSADAIIVTPRTFDLQMRFLRRYFNPVDCAQFERMLRGEEPWKPRTCLVTFDDGWADNAEHALPILRRHQVPAVVFLATGFVGTDDCFWQERLTRQLYLLWSCGESAARPLFAELDAAHILTQQAVDARRSVRELVTRLKARSAAELASISARAGDALAAAGTADRTLEDDDRFMSWSQVAALEGSDCVELGSHAHSHTPLTRLQEPALTGDLRTAQRILGEHARGPVQTFAYPNGDHDSRVVDAVRALGYRLGFTTVGGWVQAGDDVLRLKRLNIGERGTESRPQFLCRLLGWL